MNMDREIWEWVKVSGAKDISTDQASQHSRIMSTCIRELHTCLFWMRRARHKDADLNSYAKHLKGCQELLAKIDFLCALTGMNEGHEMLREIFTKMNNEHSNNHSPARRLLVQELRENGGPKDAQVHTYKIKG